MNILTFDDAVDQFRELAEARGFDVRHEPSPLNLGGSVTLLRKGNAQLRLVWDGGEELLLLQISHGPMDGPQAGWLEIFSTKCVRGSFRDPDSPEVRFFDSVEYGLELMLPAGAHGESA